MKPLHHYTGHRTVDLTEARLHCFVNDEGKRRIVALVPKTFDKGEPQAILGVNEKAITVRPYTITEWEEIVLHED